MIKKIWVSGIIMLLLLSTMISATNVSVNVWSNEDVRADIQANSNGKTEYYIDGENYKKSMNEMNNQISDKTGFSINHIMQEIGESFGYRLNHPDGLVETDNYNSLSYMQKVLRETLSRFFVTRNEYNSLKEIVKQQQLELKTLQRLFEKNEICEARVGVAKDYDLNSVKCGDKKFINNNGIDKFIAVEEIDVNSKPEINNIVKKNQTGSKEKEFKQKVKKRYEELCERGIKKFCLAIKQAEER